jgi:hypothetical protein
MSSKTISASAITASAPESAAAALVSSLISGTSSAETLGYEDDVFVGAGGTTTLPATCRDALLPVITSTWS